MTNDNKKYIPALRFPEFQNDEEWELTLVGKYYKVQGGFAFRSSEFKKSGIPIIRISNIPNDGIHIDTNNCVYYDRIANGDNFHISKGDLLIAMSGATTGKNAIYNQDGEAYLNQRVGLFRSINNQNYYPFICQWVKSDYFYSQLNRTLAAGAQPNISGKDLESFTWVYPIGDNSYCEQKKIADCLSSLDKYIDATKRKLEQLKEHKKGLMQKLFPAKGKTLPELRFPEFKNEGEWEVYALGQIFSRITEKNTLNNQNVLTISAQYGLISQYDYFNKNVAALDVSKYYLVNKGDFAYNKSKSQGYPYGAIKALKLYNQGVVSPIYICFRIKDNQNFSKVFFEYYFESELIHKEINSISQEGARNHGLLNISTEDFFAKINLYVPSLTEQFKIANTLSSIDKQIAKYDEKIKALELHKQGLMQQLFPKL